MYELVDILQIPHKLVMPQRTICTGLEALCILLKRLAYPCRYTDMVPCFGRNPTEICLIFNTLLDHLHTTHSHRLISWQQPMLQQNKLQSYADAIHLKGAPLENCFGFIDGTVRRITRPQRDQRTVYNGH